MVKKEQRKIWFAAKRFGWGWYPCTWQGWSILVIWILLFILFFQIIDRNSHSVSDTLIGMFIPTVLLIGLIIFIGFGIGEKPKWRWRFTEKS